MAGTPKSVLGQVQKDPMQGYKGVGSYQPNVIGMASGGGYSQDNAPDHTHPEFQRMQQISRSMILPNNAPRRINAPQIPGLLANPDIAPQIAQHHNMDELKGLLGTINIEAAPKLDERPEMTSYLDMSDWEEDPRSPGLYLSKSDPNKMMMAD